MSKEQSKEQRQKERRMFQRYLEDLHCGALWRERLYEDYYKSYSLRLAIKGRGKTGQVSLATKGTKTQKEYNWR